MVTQQIHGTYTETYDLNTIQNELSLLAIHTPQANSLKRMFHGFFEQYQKFKILGCNFRLTCATRQDLDPTLAGNGAGQIDPRNVLNPILFKACTGEHINALCDQIYNASEEESMGTYGGSVGQHIATESSHVAAYYSLLADDSWRKEHPQRGITVMGLKPMVHKVVTTQPFKWNVAPGSTTSSGLRDEPRMGTTMPTTPGNTGGYGFGGVSGSKRGDLDPVNSTVFVSNGMTDMPWLPTSYSYLGSYDNPDGSSAGVQKMEMLCSNIPRVYMGCLVLPPALGETGNLYFRLQIVWHILFKDFRPVQDLLALTAMSGVTSTDWDVYAQGLDNYQSTYWNLYHTAETKLEKEFGSFDSTGLASVDLITEKVK